jgi:DNA-binding PadR family transcriptional regulator
LVLRDAMLALLAKEPAHGYELRQRLLDCLGPVGDSLSPGQVYVTLGRLVRAGLVRVEEVEQSDRPDKKVYELTPTGANRVAEWLADVAWPRIGPADFHLKLVAAAVSGIADPVTLVDAQRRELLRRLHDLQQVTASTSPADYGWLLLEGTALRLQSDIRWLETCEQFWTRKGTS